MPNKKQIQRYSLNNNSVGKLSELSQD